MSVYFAVRADQPNGPVKIGFSTRVNERLKDLARSYYFGLLLIGEFKSGTLEMEQAFHETLNADNIEGEWFHNREPLRRLVAPFLLDEPKHFPCKFARHKISNLDTPKQVDKEIAKELLSRFMRLSLEKESLQYSLEAAYVGLSAINPEWTRRKIRGLWNKEAKRVEYREIRELETLLSRDQQDQ